MLRPFFLDIGPVHLLPRIQSKCLLPKIILLRAKECFWQVFFFFFVREGMLEKINTTWK